jgi:hypothetical protein
MALISYGAMGCIDVLRFFLVLIHMPTCRLIAVLSTLVSCCTGSSQQLEPHAYVLVVR